ncbi:hypothetical protein HIM_09178 [Hirsutella minnesotensis 3608]|uniref:Up-regulated in Daf-2 domain-containing protein n=1 Tax=Hirsutella minnesotensis 3608 TaxID=1043627 RepID=A0A0F8A398_9HYPO|nr:hypothetical protein HIM_09178 [Hirsutella minnesotensis 3608]
MEPSPNLAQWKPVERRARVAVVNESATPLIAVSVVHKYSDVYKNRHEWPAILPGKRSESDMIVDYHTGYTTTGRDWWLITWFSDDLKTVWFSSPTNFRASIDKLGSFAPASIEKVEETVAALLAEGQVSEEQAKMAADISCSLARATTDHLFNSEATEGFKQHILREDDADQLTEIVINSDHTITFKSKSGNSETVSSKLATSTKQATDDELS